MINDDDDIQDYVASSGWRKRQIALDIKAENARELGLDYEPDKTIIEMAREAGAVFPADGSYHQFERHEDLERFAELCRADERELCAKVCEKLSVYPELNVYDGGPDWYKHGKACAKAIRARGQA